MLKRQMGIIDSMTPRERRRPEMIDGSRKRRIAAGAGVQLPEVNRLLKQFDQMQKTMKKLAKGGMLKNMMRGMGGAIAPGIWPEAVDLGREHPFCCPYALEFITISG